MAIITLCRIEVNEKLKRRYLEDVAGYIAERERRSNNISSDDLGTNENGNGNGKDVAEETNNAKVNVLHE